MIDNFKILASAINAGDGVGPAQLCHETSLFSDVFTVEENSGEWFEVDTMHMKDEMRCWREGLGKSWGT